MSINTLKNCASQPACQKKRLRNSRNSDSMASLSGKHSDQASRQANYHSKLAYSCPDLSSNRSYQHPDHHSEPVPGSQNQRHGYRRAPVTEATIPSNKRHLNKAAGTGSTLPAILLVAHRKKWIYSTYKTLLLPAILLMALLGGCSTAPKDQRPNILFIMADDHAMQAISAYGHPLSQLAPTPHIDRLAEEGALFTANYCGNSICGPSRATILTGKHSHKHGFMRNWAQGFDGSQATLPKLLQSHGYQTALIGKWHLITKPTGFDFWKILNDQGEYNNPDFITATDTTHYSGYVTDLITGFTKEWLEQRDRGRPFFLMMHHKAPHRNWMPAERHYNRFDEVQFPLPQSYFDDYEGRFAAANQEMNIYRDMYEGHDLKMVKERGGRELRFDPWPHVWIERLTATELEHFWSAYRAKADSYFDIDTTDAEAVARWKYQRYMEDYLATIQSVDESVGEILDYLDTNELAENTIVVYTSDQGFYLGEHGWFDKRFMYEESMIMPMVMRYPGAINPGTQVTALTQNIDFAPTFLDYAGAEIPADMQGVSFRPLLENRMPEDWRTSLYYHYYEYPGFHSVRAHYGVKTERYKLIRFYKEDLWELFDLETDPLEMHNIYGSEGSEAVTSELKEELQRLQTLYEVPEEHKRVPLNESKK